MASPSIHLEHNLLPNQPFFSWLRTQTTLFISQIIGILGFISSLAALIYYASHAAESVHLADGHGVINPPNIRLFVDYAHILFLVVFIVALIRVLDDNDRGSYRVGLVYERVFNQSPSQRRFLLRKSKSQVRNFKRYFLFFWCSMLLLYISFAFKHTFEQEVSTPFFPFLTFALNNLSLLFVFWCFVVLYLPSYDRRSKKRHRMLVRSSSLIVMLLTVSFPLYGGVAGPALTDYSTVFNALSGTLNAVVVALLIARLDSKLIGLPSRLICVLYLYSAVQPFFVVFEQQQLVFQIIQTSVLIVVFIFKIYFFLIIIYTLQTGRMLNYLFCFPLLDERMNSIFEEKLLDNQSFFSWLRKQAALFMLAISGVGLFIAFIAHAQMPRATGSGVSPPDLKAFLYYAHILFLTVIVALIWVRGGKDPGAYEGKPLYEKVFGEDLSDSHGNSLKKNQSVRTNDANPAIASKVRQIRILQKSSRIQLREFKRYFLFFWVGMLLLYVSLAFELRFPDGPFNVDKISVQPRADLQDKDETVRALSAFGVNEKAETTTISQSPPGQMVRATLTKEEPILEWNIVANRLFFPFLTFLLNNVGLLFLSWCFVVLYLPSSDRRSKKRHKLLVYYSTLMVVLFTVAFPLLLFSIKGSGFVGSKLTDYSTLFNALSGTLNAVVLALLIARLDSRLIGIPSPLIFVLYLYSAVQPFFVLFQLRIMVFETIQIYVLIAAFILKIYFFLIITYTLRTGRMLNYLFCFPFLNTRVNSIFDNQFEIKVHREEENAFRFSILKKNALIYFTDSPSTSRAECDEKIHELRERMKSKNAYFPRHKNGTHWVKVVSYNITYSIVCQSIGLRSEDEVRDLIDESREKIPYCKYDRG